MGVDREREIVGQRAHFDRERGLGDQIVRGRTDHVHAEKDFRFLVGNDLHETFALPLSRSTACFRRP